ncbi:RNA-binding protein 42 [Blattella germanica]|nr:RNA-binding protein 42 [Blattella germanica]
MEDEMNRFEAEIALPVLPPPPPPPAVAPRPVIGSNTYTQVQRRLEEQQTLPSAPAPAPGPEFAACAPMPFPPMMPASVPSFPGIPPPPPPPPPPLLIPHQVQRGPPLRHPAMRGAGPPMMGGPPGPMMGGPPPPGFMGPAMTRPGPPFMGPPVPGPGPQVMPPMDRMPSPMPPTQAQVPAIVSATPKLYLPRPMVGKAEIDPADGKNKKKNTMEKTTVPTPEMSRARDMAEKVKASTVMVSVGPGPQQSTNADEATPGTGRKKEKKNKKMIRMAGGQVWEDSSLLEWEDDDFRIFCGDLGNDVTDEILTRAFSKYQSFMKAKVVRDKRSNKTKGFGFVSFKDPQDFIKAMKEMNGKLIKNIPERKHASSLITRVSHFMSTVESW